MEQPHNETLVMKILRLFSAAGIIGSIPNDIIRNSMHIRFVVHSLKKQQLHRLPPEKYAAIVFESVLAPSKPCESGVLAENNTDLLIAFLSVTRIPKAVINCLMSMVTPKNVSFCTYKCLLGYVMKRGEDFDNIPEWIFQWIHTQPAQFDDLMTVIPEDLYDTVATGVLRLGDAIVDNDNDNDNDIVTDAIRFDNMQFLIDVTIIMTDDEITKACTTARKYNKLETEQYFLSVIRQRESPIVYNKRRRRI